MFNVFASVNLRGCEHHKETKQHTLAYPHSGAVEYEPNPACKKRDHRSLHKQIANAAPARLLGTSSRTQMCATKTAMHCERTKCL